MGYLPCRRAMTWLRCRPTSTKPLAAFVVRGKLMQAAAALGISGPFVLPHEMKDFFSRFPIKTSTRSSPTSQMRRTLNGETKLLQAERNLTRRN